MGTIQTLTRFGLLAVLVLCSVGCAGDHSLRDSYVSMKRTLRLAPEPPVSQVFCSWHRRLGVLQDPANEGMQVRGIVGQVFMVNEESTAATAEGDLTITAYDSTPRPGTMPEKPASVWHFTKEVLQNMRTRDERFGRCYVVFLPWPEEWTDVAQVRLTARYDGKNEITIFAPEVRLTIDYTSPGEPVWVKKNDPMGGMGGLGGTGGMGQESADRRGAINPRVLLDAITNGTADQGSAIAGLPQTYSPLVRPTGKGLPEMKSNVPVYGEPIVPTSGSAPQPIGDFQVPQLMPNQLEMVPKLAPGANTRYATEGAYAAPPPPRTPFVKPNAPGSDGPIQPIILPIRKQD